MIKTIVKPLGRLMLSMFGFMYDFNRYRKYSGFKCDYRDPSVRNYYVAKVYHSLEKSMSFKNRKLGSGWKDVALLCDVLEAAFKEGRLGFHDFVGFEILDSFIKLGGAPDEVQLLRAQDLVANFLASNDFLEVPSGSIKLSKEDIFKGRLENPENFFFTRYSLREYSEEPVSDEIISRAIKLAMKTPSACNRQPWHVYQISEREKIDIALSFQSGNRGFGHKVPMLLLITMDLKAFVPAQERYQHWIDGGMFSMSIIYALPSLGLSSCCLNWSKLGGEDLKLRRALNLDSEHTVMMMLAVGHPDDDNNLCVSPRRPLNEVITKL